MKRIHLTNSLLNLSDTLQFQMSNIICSTIVKMECLLRGIRIGKACRFYGKVRFKKANKAMISIGDSCTFRSSPTSNLIGVNRPCILSALNPGAKLTIGDNCGFSGTVVGCFKEIHIGRNSRCGANTLLTDSDWHLSDPRAGQAQAITIGENVWIGVSAIVMKGVAIGDNTVIGAGSVVTKNIPPNVIAAGNPCRVIKPL
jgi:acetyltransferase-like isoleucine patch superfamily enzyme